MTDVNRQKEVLQKLLDNLQNDGIFENIHWRGTDNPEFYRELHQDIIDLRNKIDERIRTLESIHVPVRNTYYRYITGDTWIRSISDMMDIVEELELKRVGENRWVNTTTGTQWKVE